MISEILFVLFVAVFTVGSAQYRATRRCTKQSDCLVPFECCSKRFMEPEAYCVSRRQLGQLCMDLGIDQEMINGTYDITCPCAIGLECIKPKYFNNLGQLLYTRNPRCQVVGAEQPPLEFYKNLDSGRIFASNANANANPNANAYASAGNNGYGGNDAYAPRRNNAFASSGNNAFASSGNNGFYTDGSNAIVPNGGNSVYASNGQNGYGAQANAVAY